MISATSHILHPKTSSRALSPRIDRMNTIMQMMSDTNLLPGYDIGHNSRSYYHAQCETARENDQGAATRYHDSKHDFVKGHPGEKCSGVIKLSKGKLK